MADIVAKLIEFAERVEICRLSIWIKTAKHGKVLADLNENIRVGNSIVADPTVTPAR